MADEPKGTFAPCVACGGPAFSGYQRSDGTRFNLCFQHAQQFDAQNLRHIEVYQERMHDLEDQLDDIWRLPRKPRPQPAPRVHVNQIHIQNNNGVVNTGTVRTIENRVTVIHQTDAALADQLKALTEAIINSPALDQTQKQQAADLITEVVDDVARPPQQRRSRAVMMAITNALGQVLAHAADLYTLWEAVQKHLPG